MIHYLTSYFEAHLPRFYTQPRSIYFFSLIDGVAENTTSFSFLN